MIDFIKDLMKILFITVLALFPVVLSFLFNNTFMLVFSLCWFVGVIISGISHYDDLF